MDASHVEFADNSAHIEYVEDTGTEDQTQPGPQGASSSDNTNIDNNTISSTSSNNHSDNTAYTQGTMTDNLDTNSDASRPGPLRRKSTLLLKGEIDPEFDEDMEFNRLNIATGEPVGTPLSRAGSGDEVQIGDEEAAEAKFDTVITWNQGGNKVYVTGSFTGWRKMIKLNKQTDGTFSIVLKLPTGTHRMRFVVDNELRCSDSLSSATDSMGNLVNYIEVPFESQPHPHAQQQATNGLPTTHDPSFASSMASAGTAYTNDDSMEPLHRAPSNYYAQQQAAAEMSSQAPPPYNQPYETSGQTPRLLRATTVEKVTNYDMSNDDELLNGGGYERFQEELPAAPVYTFSSEIPRVFTDPEVMERFVGSDFVIPPQLPPHLESVILNSNSNEKDNNSVLPIPNHVVLNHLATTSIKHNVLAVATVSRYSRKYVTQILYAPL